MKQRKTGSSAKAHRPAARPRPPIEPGARGAKAKRKSAAIAADRVYILAAECTVAESVALKQSLLPWLEQSAPLTIDLSQVQRVDTAGMQLIAAFVREREAQGLPVRWRGHAPAFAGAADLLGLRPVLRLADRAS